MATTQTVSVPTVSKRSPFLRWLETYFYFCMSLLVAAVVVYGFSQTIERRLIAANPQPPSLLWAHAILFSLWIVFYISQSALVRIRKVRLHRTLGWAGATLGASMLIVGFWVAVVMARFDTNLLHRPNRDAFLIVPLFDIVAFAIFLCFAILWRRNPDRHRRLMLIATCVLTGAAFGRMPTMHAPLHFYGGVDGLILLGVLCDFVVRRRIHRVYSFAVPLLVAGQIVVSEIFLHRATLWIRVAHQLLA